MNSDREVETRRRRRTRGRSKHRQGRGGRGSFGKFFAGGYKSAASVAHGFRSACIRVGSWLRQPKVLAALVPLLAIAALAVRAGLSTWTISTVGGSGTWTLTGREWVGAKATLAWRGLEELGTAKGTPVESAVRRAGTYPWNDQLQRDALEAILRFPQQVDALTASRVSGLAQWFLLGARSGDELKGIARRALLVARQFDEVPGVWDVSDARDVEDVRAAIVAAMESMHPEIVPWLWARLPEGMRAEDALRDCHSAWEAGWGDGSRVKAVEEVRRWVVQVPGPEETQERRLRLALLTSVGLMDDALGAAAMSGLSRIGKSRAGDHAVFWELLRSVGREDEVARLASALGARPAMAGDGKYIMAAWVRHGLPELGAEAVIRFPDVAGLPHPYPMTLAGAFIHAGRWPDLSRFASQVGYFRGGQDPKWNSMRAGYAAFLAAIAANGIEASKADDGSRVQGAQRESMEGRLRIAIEMMAGNDVVAADMASVLDSMGYPEFGRRALELASTAKPSGVDAWRKVAWVSRRAGMDEILLAASARLVELGAEVPMHRWYFLEANANVVAPVGKPPAKALESLPGIKPLLVHEFFRVIGMAKAGLTREASSLLASLPSSGLSKRESSWRNIAMIEVGAYSGEKAQLRRLAEGIALGCVGKARQAWIRGILGTQTNVVTGTPGI